MAQKKRPAAQGSASRAPITFSLAVNVSEIPQSLALRQSDFVARRFGLSTAVAALVAQHAFSNGRAA
jgi:hypothetical protein